MPSFLKHNFAAYRILFDSPFLSSLTSGLHDFSRETHHHLNCFSLMQIRFYFCLSTFKIVSFSLVFRSLIVLCLSINSFFFFFSLTGFAFTKVFKPFAYVLFFFFFFTKFGKSSTIIFEYF